VAPAAPRTSKKVPNASAKRRRHSKAEVLEIPSPGCLESFGFEEVERLGLVSIWQVLPAFRQPCARANYLIVQRPEGCGPSATIAILPDGRLGRSVARVSGSCRTARGRRQKERQDLWLLSSKCVGQRTDSSGGEQGDHCDGHEGLRATVTLGRKRPAARPSLGRRSGAGDPRRQLSKARTTPIPSPTRRARRSANARLASLECRQCRWPGRRQDRRAARGPLGTFVDR